MFITLVNQLLTPEERAKIRNIEGFDNFDKTGLYGQFPHITASYQARRDSMESLFKDAEETIMVILTSEGFSGFRGYMRGPTSCRLIATSLDLIIEGKVRASQYTIIWSINRGDNRNLMLVLHEKKLKLCISEFVYQGEHMGGGGIHWCRIISDSEKLEHDCYRLYEALKILADPRTAWDYLRARVLSIELSINSR